MSIATEITRLQKAKADIKTAIEEKGVTVGDGLIDTYADKIGEIPGGGDNFYDAFWDVVQESGTRTDYSSGFRYDTWNNATFKPKYKMYPTNASYMFADADMGDSDFGADFDSGNYESEYVDFSNCTNMLYCFTRSTIKRLPILNLTKVAAFGNTFAVMQQLERIEKIILSENSGLCLQNNTFNSCSKLSYIRFEGKICSRLNMGSCPLSVDSMKDIIAHLENLVEIGEEGNYTLTFSNICWETLEASGVAPDGGTWLNYVNNTLGWTT